MSNEDDMSRGIFSPMFERETLEEVEATLRAEERARRDGASPFGRVTRIAEAREGVSRVEARQRMLLIERLVDEMPDTVDYFRDRMSGHVRSVSRNFWGRVVLRGLTRVDRYLVLLVAKASEEVYRKRLDRTEAMARMGRDPLMGGTAAPQEVAAESLRVRLTDKVTSITSRPIQWVLRRMNASSEE